MPVSLTVFNPFTEQPDPPTQIRADLALRLWIGRIQGNKRDSKITLHS